MKGLYHTDFSDRKRKKVPFEKNDRNQHDQNRYDEKVQITNVADPRKKDKQTKKRRQDPTAA